MNIAAFVFYSLAGTTLLCALLVVLLRNVLHSALFLGLCMLGIAGLFASLGADFLFTAQILVYVGGISVLILFAVLLAGRASELVMRQTNDQVISAAFICLMSLAALLHYLRPFRDKFVSAPPQPTTALLGRLLLGEWTVPFELVSLVLLVSLTGAIIFSKTEEAE